MNKKPHQVLAKGLDYDRKFSAPSGSLAEDPVGQHVHGACYHSCIAASGMMVCTATTLRGPALTAGRSTTAQIGCPSGLDPESVAMLRQLQLMVYLQIQILKDSGSPFVPPGAGMTSFF
jgi:hypothetical protein